MNLDLLGLHIDSPLVHPRAENFRPSSWPPSPDWAPILDAKGNPVCKYSDSIWPLDIWAGKPRKLNFSDGKTRGPRIDAANANLLRQCVIWFMYGTRGCQTAASLVDKHSTIKPIFVICSREGIVASDLMRFEAVIDKIGAELAPSLFYKVVAILHTLLDARDQLGFCLLDRQGLARLVKFKANHEKEQTPYIPPRIWTYQLNRLRECLEDYQVHKGRIADCYKFMVEAYAENFGSLEAAMRNTLKDGNAGKRPFQNRRKDPSSTHHGSFKLTCDRFGITDLLTKWIGPFTGAMHEKQVSRISRYFELVSQVGRAYLLNFSLMRVSESSSLRSDCLIIEHDNKFGDIPILVGKTTKTLQDSEARWPVSKSARLAVDVLTHISTLRMGCASTRDDLGITQYDKDNPYLFSYQYEPWGIGKHMPYDTRPIEINYRAVISAFPLLFETKQITINEDDLRIARMMTPTLDLEIFRIGSMWPLAWHQLRRTGAVNMQSSGLVDDSSLQVLLKHQSRVMTLYYGRNHERLTLNDEARTLYLKTMYQEQARSLTSLGDSRFTSPLGEKRKDDILNLISDKDASTLTKLISKGEVSVRKIRAGFCFNTRPCPYGGIESISHCLGTRSRAGCPDLLLDGNNIEKIERYEKIISEQLEVVNPKSPRFKALTAEKEAIAKYYAHHQIQESRR